MQQTLLPNVTTIFFGKYDKNFLRHVLAFFNIQCDNVFYNRQHLLQYATTLLQNVSNEANW